MDVTRTIQVFLASSDELKNDRNTFGNLIRRLDNIYEKRGIRIKLVEWEDCDAAYNNLRKQDEYNVEVKASDMFLALFYKKAGKFTVEEFDVATKEFQRTGIKPKPYVYCRDLPEGEQESEELKEFKRRLFEEMGHYWSQYNNEDSLQLHFVMQLQLVENSRLDNLKVENGEVKLEDSTIARMEHLRFAADNPDYQRMSHRLQELALLIEKARLRAEKYPNDQDLVDDLQKLLNEKNQLQKDFDQHQQLLFDTAKRIATLHGEAITDRMRRAIKAFERGDVRESNIILDEAEHDASRNLTDYLQSKAHTEQKRQNVIHSIEELLLKASTLMADASLDITERIERVHSIYAQADEVAHEIAYNREKYSDLLFDYARFLETYGLYRDAEQIFLRQIRLAEECYGLGHVNTASSHNCVTRVYRRLGDFQKALEHSQKALFIDKKAFGKNNVDLAFDYNSIGGVYWEKGDYKKALKYYKKALEIHERVLGQENPITAIDYNDIGTAYTHLQDLTQASKYLYKALEVRESIFGENHPITGVTYSNIGIVYRMLGDYNHALMYYVKALEIHRSILGPDHFDTAIDLGNIGMLFLYKLDLSRSLKYLEEALRIFLKVVGSSHPKTIWIQTYFNEVKKIMVKLEMEKTTSESVMEDHKPEKKTFLQRLFGK